MGRDGEASRFDALVREHGPAIASLLARFVRDPAAADDLYQDVFSAAWRRFGSLDPARDPRPFLRTLALNRVIDHFRRAAARPLISPEVDPDSRPARAEALAPGDRPLEAALDRLSDHERAAILLYYQEGLSIADVAAAFRVPAGTVKSWLFRARERLRGAARAVESEREAR